jgi:hypothetical protein
MINLSGSHPLACITGLSSRGDNLLCAQISCQGAWLLPPGLVDPDPCGVSHPEEGGRRPRTRLGSASLTAVYGTASVGPSRGTFQVGGTVMAQ